MTRALSATAALREARRLSCLAQVAPGQWALCTWDDARGVWCQGASSAWRAALPRLREARARDALALMYPDYNDDCGTGDAVEAVLAWFPWLTDPRAILREAEAHLTVSTPSQSGACAPPHRAPIPAHERRTTNDL